MTKISQLSDIGGSLAAGDEFVVRDVSDISTPNKKVTASGFIDYVIAQGVGSGFTQISAGATAPASVRCFSSGTTREVIVTTSGVERARFTTAGQLRMAGAGITFNGDTAAANELDDYEEGTFTPILTFGGGSTGLTYALQAGAYTKVGRKVHVIIEILLSAKGSSTGTASVGGLPFTSSARSFAATVNACGSVVFTNGYLNGGVNATATTITLYNTPTSGGIVVLSDTAFTNATGMRIDATYYV